MNTHPLVARVAASLASLRTDTTWEDCVPDALSAIRSVADWTEELHRSAQADLLYTDCFVTVPYLHSVVDGAHAGEHPEIEEGP